MTICKTPSFPSQVMYLSRQLNPRKPSAILTAYEEATQKPYSYLFLNLHPSCHDHLRIQSGILPEEDHYIHLPI